MPSCSIRRTVTEPGRAPLEAVPSSNWLSSRSALHHPQRLPVNNGQDDGFTRTNPRAQSVHRDEAFLRQEPSHLFLIDLTLGVLVDHHGSDKPIPDQPLAAAFQNPPHVPSDDVFIGIRQSFSPVLGEAPTGPVPPPLILDGVPNPI